MGDTLPFTLVYRIREYKNIRFLFYDAEDISINWGDGTINGVYEHNYHEEGEYTVQITGRFTRIDLYDDDDCKCLIKCLSFGPDSIGITSFAYLFSSCSELIEVPNYLPSTVTNLSCMFKGSSFNGDISNRCSSNK